MSATAEPEEALGWVPEDNFGLRLIALRKKKGWTQAEAAGKCGVDDGSWSNWENGAMPRDLPSVVEKIVRATDVNRSWLAWGDPSIRWNSDAPHLTSVPPMVGELPLPFDEPPPDSRADLASAAV